jgi:putative integral membrane protein (TIGR02587 family)
MSGNKAENSGQSGGGGSQHHHEQHFWIGVARGFGGALLFAMPILMTMETWWLGFYAGRWRLAIYLVLSIPLVLGLAYFAGLKQDIELHEVVLDGMTAYAIGILTSVVVLSLMGILSVQMAPREIIGKIAVQTPTAAFGAVLARSQLGSGGREEKQKKQQSGYPGELFLVAAGAFYLASTVASTEEMILIPFKMTTWHAAALIVFSLLVMHAFLYTMKFKGAPTEAKGTP